MNPAGDLDWIYYLTPAELAELVDLLAAQRRDAIDTLERLDAALDALHREPR